MNRLRTAVLVGLLGAVIVSALEVVYTKHQSRKLFAQLQALYGSRDAMEIEWGQLQLEQSTHTTHERIEQVALRQLGMVAPTTESLVIIRR